VCLHQVTGGQSDRRGIPCWGTNVGRQSVEANSVGGGALYNKDRLGKESAWAPGFLEPYLGGGREEGKKRGGG